MKIGELREKLKGREKEELQTLLVDLYKLIPKSIKDEKNIDALIDNPTRFKQTGIKEPTAAIDLDTLKREVEHFIKQAYAQNYIAPNRIIPKKERSNWRTLAKRLIEQVTELAKEEEHQGTCAILLEKLYMLFCYASGHYTFVSEEPFRTLKIPQEVFLKRVIVLKKQVDESQQWIRDSLVLIVEQGTDYETSTSTLLTTLLDELPTPALKAQAAQICTQLVSEYEEKLAQPKKSKSSFGSNSEYRQHSIINTLIEMHFMLQSALNEYEEATNYFQQHSINHSDEVRLYILLQLTKSYQHPEHWIKVYELAVASGVAPRNELTKEYAHIKKNHEFTFSRFM